MMGLDEIRAANAFASHYAPLPRVDDVREYVTKAVSDICDMARGGTLASFPATKGYLRALLAVAKDALHEDMHALPFNEAEALANGREFCRLCDKDEHVAKVHALTEAA